MRPGDFDLPGLPKLPGLDHLDPFRDHGHHHDPIQDIVQSIYQPGGPLNLFDRGMHGPNMRNLPIMEIVDNIHHQMERMSGDTYHARYGQQGVQRNPYEQIYQPSTSRELMDTLDRHRPFISGGDYVDKRDLRDYLRESRDVISPRDRKNLIEVLANFDRIASSDGRRDTVRGISSGDMNAFVDQNQRRDQNIDQRRDRNVPHDRYPDGRPVPDVPRRQGEDPRYAPSDRGARSRNPNDRVMTETDPTHNNHFRVEGDNLPLSQEEFKRFYNIPQDVDLQKFMNGKPNDGKVVDYWQAGVSGGLGGPKDPNHPELGLKWNDPNYHTLKYDFSRNLEQVIKYTQGMSEHDAKQFVFNFARTQGAVAESNGFKLNVVENETVTSTGEGRTGTTDFIQDIGGKNIIQW
jgi:hypothetical protein